MLTVSKPCYANLFQIKKGFWMNLRLLFEFS